MGLFVILAAVVTCLTTNHVMQADEAKSKRPATRPTSVAKTSDQDPSELSKTESELVNKIFGSRLLEIAAEYKHYSRVDQTMRWSPTLCEAPPKLPEKLGALSASDSKETHGRKLYFLYARKPWNYRADISDRLRKNKESEVRAPLGQVLVKEAWNPVKVDPTKGSKLDKTRAYATQGKNTYYAGDKKGLFVMFKTKPGTPGTDQGWVYGTVSADGKQVTSVGLVKNCMQCHQDAPYDRQIGLSSLIPTKSSSAEKEKGLLDSR